MLTSEHIKYKDNTSYLSLLDILYPVGSIFITVGSTNPASHLGGSWIEVTDGVIAAKGYGTVGNNAGSKTIAITQIPGHTHTGYSDYVATSHSHTISNWILSFVDSIDPTSYRLARMMKTTTGDASYVSWNGKPPSGRYTTSWNSASHQHTITTYSTGGGNNICLIHMLLMCEGECLRGGIICLL